MTATQSCQWFIRKTSKGIRAVCKGDGTEQLVGPRFATEKDARRYIASEFEGGALSPMQKYQRDVAAAIERDGREGRLGPWAGD